MPWSDWQDPFEMRTPASLLQLHYTVDGAEGVLNGSGQFESDYNFDGGFFGLTIIGYQYSLPSGWDTRRIRPPEMLDMEVGVDYAQVPDQPGVYYEYEDGPNAFVGWDVPPIVLTNNYDTHPGRTLDFRMELSTTHEPGLLDAEYDPGRGTPIGVFNGSTPVGTTIANPNPGLAQSFSLWPSREAEYDFSAANEYMFYFGYISVRARTLTPPWRYWIPDPLTKPPLRLRQRDDNLFLNAPHLRNRASRQTTNRLRSYD